MALSIGGNINFGGNITIGNVPAVISTGGTTSTFVQNGNNYTLHTFTANGTFTLNYPYPIEYLVIGPGGAGGNGTVGASLPYVSGGGGGAGQVCTGTQTIDGGTYTIIVGSGPGSGANSAIIEIGITSVPGGVGGTWTNGGNGGNGASGGGTSGYGANVFPQRGYPVSYPAFTSGWRGGYYRYPDGSGGAGGGFTSDGQDATNPWYGGNGFQSNFAGGGNVWYACGGGGGSQTTARGWGGPSVPGGGISGGAGGDGGYRSGSPGTPVQANAGVTYGSGGGGATYITTGNVALQGGAGAPGVVMIRYQTP